MHGIKSKINGSSYNSISSSLYNDGYFSYISANNGFSKALQMKAASGKRAVATKASAEVIENVLKNGRDFVGQANVMGEPHHAAYLPLKNEMDEVINNFIFSTLSAAVIIVVVCTGILNFFIGKIIAMLDEVILAMKKISGGDLRIADLEIRTDDEIGILSVGVNDMRMVSIEEVNKISHEILNAVDKVKITTNTTSTHANEVSAATEEQTATMHEIAAASQSLAELATDMQSDVSKFSL